MELVKTYPYRLSTSMVIFANITTAGLVSFFVYVFTIQTLELNFFLIALSSIVIIFIFLLKKQLEYKFIKLYKDKIEIPVGNKSRIFSFSEIKNVEEIHVQGFCLCITDLSGKSFNIEQQRMQLKDYFELHDSLVQYSSIKQISPELKRKRKLILIGVLLILLVSTIVIGILHSFEGKLFRPVAGITFLVFFLTGMTVMINNMQDFHRQNRKIFLDPRLNKRRSILGAILGTFILVSLSSAIYFMIPKNRLDADFVILYPSLIIPVILYLLVENSLRLKEFVSKSERALYFFVILFIGSINLAFTGPHIIKVLFPQAITTKEQHLRPMGTRGCYSFPVDSLFPPEICPYQFPLARDNVKIKYDENTNLSGIRIYDNFRIPLDDEEKKSSLDINLKPKK